MFFSVYNMRKSIEREFSENFHFFFFIRIVSRDEYNIMKRVEYRKIIKTFYIKTKKKSLTIISTIQPGMEILWRKTNIYIKKGILFAFNPLKDGFWIQNSRIKPVVVRFILILFAPGKGWIISFYSTFFIIPFSSKMYWI